MANQQATIVVKKVKKVVGGHHGGAWKIAYADFVTAMMAFFLLLWLLNSVTQEALEGISNYFAPVSVSASTSGSGGLLGGQVLSVEGAGTSQSGQLAQSLDLSPPRAGTGGDSSASKEDVSEQIAREKIEQIEKSQFEAAQKAIADAIETSDELKELSDSLQIKNTPEGLQIQILDIDKFAMFQSGSSVMNEQTRKMIELISKVIQTMPQKLSITGHTDSVPFHRADGYGNWELSADRANSARRELLFNNIPEERFARVVGKAATAPLLPEDPTNASNRRLSIILLKGTGQIEPVKEISVDEDTDKVDPIKIKKSLSTASGLKKSTKKSSTFLDTQDAGDFAKDLLTDEDEAEDEDEEGLPGLNQIKQKQLDISQ